MAYFPAMIMPKKIQKETSNEVDGSPNIYNAFDNNKHEREVIAIERYLVGEGAGSPSPNRGLLGILAQCYNQFKAISNNGLILQCNGTVIPNAGFHSVIPIPQNISQTTTKGAVLASATTIPVASTAGFPSSGYITKFNGFTNNFNFAQMTNQEIISYTGLTATSFTGCSRGIEGNAQDVVGSVNAVILGGKASLSLSHKSLIVTAASSENLVDSTTTGRVQAYHDMGLNVFATAFNADTSADISTIFEVQYSLNIVGSFKNLMA